MRAGNFDPLTNEEVREILGQMDSEQLHAYYQEPVMRLLKVKDSVDTLENQDGSSGCLAIGQQILFR